MRFKPSPYLLLVIATLCWAGNFTLGRAVSGEIPPVTLSFWRWTGAGIVLLPFVWRDIVEKAARLRHHWKLMTLLGLTGLAMFQTFAYIGLNTTTTINATLMLSTTPLAMPVAAYLILGERLTWGQAAGIVLSLVGVGVIVTRADLSTLSSLSFTPGDLWVLGAVPIWAIYSSLLKKLPDGLSTSMVLCVISLIAGGILAPFYAWEITRVGTIAVNAANMASIAYVIVFAAVIAFLAWNRAVAQIGANRSGPFAHLVPVFAAVLAIVFLGESLYLFHGIGIAFIVAGLVIAARHRPA